jgi:uncharacterized protein YndB with AHSA1/START domain
MPSNSLESYSTELTVHARPEDVYRALTLEVDRWWTESANRAGQSGDILTVRFEEDTMWALEVLEAKPNRRLVWEVIEANHDLSLLSRKDEWLGTYIHWEIEDTSSKTRITFTHEGLAPPLQCFEVCTSGWDYFLGSLKSFLETGEGHPFSQ